MITISYFPAERENKNLIVLLNSREVATASTYYFSLMGVENGLDIVEVICEFYQGLVRSLNENCKPPFFLPLDLSDQYVGGLLFSTKSPESIFLTYGYITELEGWEVSLDGGLIFQVDSFQALGKKVELSSKECKWKFELNSNCTVFLLSTHPNP